MANKELEDLLEKIKKFRDERDWKQFHNHKDMAISIVLEASELLEHFQWKSPEEIRKAAIEKKEEIGEELADIFIYLLELSDEMGIDLIEASEKKLKKNEIKYPVNKSKGTAKKYVDL
ncbi:MAG: nucleotide pyrophosphohydrolase [Candidatus Aenigmatarchaeota archaeon]